MIQIFRVTIAVPPNHSRVVGYYSDERLAHKEALEEQAVDTTYAGPHKPKYWRTKSATE